MRQRSRPITRLDVQVGRTVAVLMVLGILGTATSARDDAQPPRDQSKTKSVTNNGGAAGKQEAKSIPLKLGLSLNEMRAFPGYTLLAPLDSTNTYLLDMQGKVVQSWASDCLPALYPMLLENGHLLRPGSIGNDSRVFESQSEEIEEDMKFWPRLQGEP